MRVALIVLDGFPTRHVGPSLTPHLWRLAEEAGAPPATATGVMPSATYPNHATFVTGTPPADHGVVANWIFDGGRPVPAESVGPRGRTLFDACRSAERSSALVVGDQHLVGVMAGDRADHHWPEGGRVPGDARLDAMGYVVDADSMPRLAAALHAGHDLVVAQINGPDTAGHLFGPDSAEALDAYRDTDRRLADLRHALDAHWDDTVAVVVSDHTMETLTHPEPIDILTIAAEHGMGGLPEGGAALVEGDGDLGWLSALAGCAGHRPIGPGLHLAWTHPGHWFAVDGLDTEYRGMHGNPACLEQLALVTGGHPAARRLARAAAEHDVTALDWAPTVGHLLSLDLPDATGRNLLAS